MANDDVHNRKTDAGPTGKRETFFPFAVLRENVWAWLGFASFLGWINVLICFEGVLRDTVEEAGGLVHDPVFLGLTLVAGILLLGCSSKKFASSALADKLVKKRAVILVAGAGLVFSAFAVIFALFAAEIGKWLSLLLGAGLGFTVFAFTMIWGRVFAALDLRKTLLIVCLSFCLQWIPLLLVPLIHDIGNIVLVMLLVLVSGAALVHLVAREEFASTSEVPKGEDSQGRKVLPRIVLAMFCFSASIQFIWTFFIAMTPAYLPISSFVWVFLVVIISTLVLMIALIAFMEKQQAYRIDVIYRTAFVFCLLAACVLGIALDHLFESYVVVYVAYSFVVPTMWMLALGFIFMTKAKDMTVIGRVFGVQYVGLFVGFFAARLIQPFFGRGEGLSLSPYATLVIVAILSIVYVTVLPERSLLALSPRMFGINRVSIEKRCEDLGSQYGLSKREQELFNLFARGRSTKYIEEHLFISKNTIATHRKNIYRKLGIHSQQELLSLIEGSLAK